MVVRLCCDSNLYECLICVWRSSMSKILGKCTNFFHIKDLSEIIGNDINKR